MNEALQKVKGARRVREDPQVVEQRKVAELYASACFKAGVPPDQMENFIRAGIYLFPKQIEASAAARACDAVDGPTRIGFGGPRGPGKSFWQFAQMLADDMQRFSGLKFLIIRKTQKAIREQLRDVLGKVCGTGNTKRIAHDYKEQKGVIDLPNGSYAVVGHFKDEKDLDHYLGQEYDGLLIEEANTLTHTKVENIFTCLRTSKPGWRPRAYLTWNWGGIGHGWLLKQFYEPWENRAEKNTRYVLATVHDNPAINPEYIDTLKKLTGWKYKSWYLGDPHFQAGQFFTNWDESWHVYPNKHATLTPLNPVKWFGSLDYGFAHPTSFHLHCNDDRGNTFTVGRVHKSQAVIEEIVQDIISLLKGFQIGPHHLDFIAAGKDCFSRKQDGRTIADEYEDCGINLTSTEVDRVNGWAVMQQRLGDPARGIEPSWFIHKSCVELITQIPLAQNHETRPGDIEKMDAEENGDGGDDALDSCRNALLMEGSGNAITSATPFHFTSFQPAMLDWK